MSVKTIQILFIVTGITLVVFLWITKGKFNVNQYIRDIRSGYAGKIVDIYEAKTMILKIQINESDEYKEEGMLSNKLLSLAHVGDSIFKIPNENYVIIKNARGECHQVPFLYISSKIRNSRYWPKDWKDKWLESSY
ncbi:MAG: hypothetical protein JWM14_3418 [Chitinophagaceae bacterium]|nr:hypothetical protein [Chitinophagaceae bacterium]